MNQASGKVHFVDIDAPWTALGLIARRGDNVVFVRSNRSSSAPTLKEMRFPGHLLNLVKDAPAQRFDGQPYDTETLAHFRVTGPGGGLLIASFGPLSAFDKKVESERHMPVTVY